MISKFTNNILEQFALLLDNNFWFSLLISTTKLLDKPKKRLFKKVMILIDSNLFLEKYTEIERENKILLEKMSNIMQDSRPKLYNPSN